MEYAGDPETASACLAECDFYELPVQGADAPDAKRAFQSVAAHRAVRITRVEAT